MGKPMNPDIQIIGIPTTKAGPGIKHLSYGTIDATPCNLGGHFWCRGLGTDPPPSGQGSPPPAARGRRCFQGQKGFIKKLRLLEKRFSCDRETGRTDGSLGGEFPLFKAGGGRLDQPTEIWRKMGSSGRPLTGTGTDGSTQQGGQDRLHIPV